VDDITGRHFWLDPAPTDRTYIPRWSQIQIDDLVEADEVTADGVTLTEGSDFILRPLNAVADGKPYSKIELLSTASTWPTFRAPSLVVTGTFGWPVVPDAIVAATTILASRFLRRQREAPFGIVTVGIEQGAVARIMSTDPDVKTILCNYIREKVLIAVA